MTASCRVMGLDPGLRHTGWGVIDVAGSHLRHIAHGAVHSDAGDDLSTRLRQLHDQLSEVLDIWQPDEAAVEETFVNKNPLSTLKLGQARGVVLLIPALRGIPVAEYAPNMVKKTVVGSGHAHKEQIHAMLGMLLPGVKIRGGDAADALSVAICHAYQRQTRNRLSDLGTAAEQRP